MELKPTTWEWKQIAEKLVPDSVLVLQLADNIVQAMKKITDPLEMR